LKVHSLKTLRTFLRDEASEAHALLDSSLRRFDLSSRTGYARFLAWQLEARMPVEEWLAGHFDPSVTPPASAPALLGDLARLRLPIFIPHIPFDVPADADAIGVAWGIAGSHLGNRAILAQLRKNGASWPTHFLGDERMTAFWKGLLPALDREVTADRAERAVIAARALFKHFHAILEGGDGKIAA